MPSILYESFGEGMKRQTNLSRDPDQPLELSIVCKTFPNSAGNSFNHCGGFSTPRSPSYLKQWGFRIRTSFWILIHPGPRCSDQKIWYFCPICLLAPFAWPQTSDLGHEIEKGQKSWPGFQSVQIWGHLWMRTYKKYNWEIVYIRKFNLP